ncbi:hypothetical protein MAR621_03010 [Maribacter dokdonensis]|nr:hypothetical protein MAR621_03010 [Maribacter dokdonensis]
MRTFFALLLNGLIVAIPTAIIFYLSSYVIVELFGGEIYVAILFSIAMFFVFAKIFKIYKRVKDWNS